MTIRFPLTIEADSLVNFLRKLEVAYEVDMTETRRMAALALECLGRDSNRLRDLIERLMRRIDALETAAWNLIDVVQSDTSNEDGE